MRNLKRVLSLGLSTAMLIGLMVTGSSAAGYDDVSSDHHEEAIEVLQAVGVMVGDESGNFNPDENVTRNEMAVVMSNLMDYNVATYSGTSPFTDVPSWAEPYVAACWTNKITSGYSATTYGGSDTVTTAQAALMLMKALGYFQYQSDFSNDWQLATVTQGNRIALFKDVDSGVRDAMTRNELAQLVLNTLKSGMVEPNDDTINVTTPDGTTVNAGRIEYTYVTSTDSYATAIKDLYPETSGTSISTSGAIVELGEYLYEGDLKMYSADDGERDNFGRPANRWTYRTSEIGVYAETPIATYTAKVERGTLYSLIGRSNVNDLRLNGRGSSDVLSVYSNGQDASIYGATPVTSVNDVFRSNSSAAVMYSGKGVLTEVYQDTDNNVDVVQVVTYVAQANGDYNKDLGELRTVTLTAPDGSGFNLGTLDSEDYEGLDQFADGDYILYTVSNSDNAGWELESIAKAEVVTGEVTAYSNTSSDPGFGSAEGYVTIGGTQYDYAKYAETDDENGCSVEFTVGADAAIVVDQYGYALYVDDASLSVGNYLYVNGIIKGTGFGNTLIANVYFSDGTTGNITLDTVRNASGGDITDNIKRNSNIITVSNEANQGPDAGNSNAPFKGHDYDGWYSYSVSDGEYTLRQVESGIGSGSTAVYGAYAVLVYDTNDLVTTGESVRFLYQTGNGGTVGTMVNVRGNDNTIFLVDNGSSVTAYTGINNLPDITVRDNPLITGEKVYVSYLIEKDEAGKTNAALVYIYADEDMADIDGGSDSDLLFVLNRSQRKVDRVNGDVVEVWNAILNGELTTIEAKENEFESYTMYYKLTQDSDGYYKGDEFVGGTSDRRQNSLLISNGDQVDYSSGTLALGNETYAVNSDTQIVLVLQDATGGAGNETGSKDKTNNLGALTTDGGVIVMRDNNAKHEVYNVNAQSLENYLRDRDVTGSYYGIVTDSDSDLLKTLYVVITDVTTVTGESPRYGT